jgi:MYXO-CTERM domain-containing protein
MYAELLCATLFSSQLVADLEPGEDAPYPLAPEILASNGVRALFFDGNDLVSTDGTEAGTVELVPRINSAELAVFDGRFYIAGSLGRLGNGLFTTDGLTLPTLVIPVFGLIDQLRVVGGKLSFHVEDNGGENYFLGDGTQLGTYGLFSNLNFNEGGLRALLEHRGTYYFFSSRPRVSFFASDGTRDSAVLKDRLQPRAAQEVFAVAAGGQIFVVFDRLFYRGNEDGFSSVRNGEIGGLTAVGDKAIFYTRGVLIATSTTGEETVLDSADAPRALETCGEHAYFVGSSIIRTDGTLADTNSWAPPHQNASGVDFACAGGRALYWICSPELTTLNDAENDAELGIAQSCAEKNRAALVDGKLLYTLGNALWLDDEDPAAPDTPFWWRNSPRSSYPLPLFTAGDYLYLRTGDRVIRWNGTDFPSSIGAPSLVVDFGDRVLAHYERGLSVVDGVELEQRLVFRTGVSLGSHAAMVAVDDDGERLYCAGETELRATGSLARNVQKIVPIGRGRAMVQQDLAWSELDCETATLDSFDEAFPVDFARAGEKVIFFDQSAVRVFGTGEALVSFDAPNPELLFHAHERVLLYRDGGFIRRTDGTRDGTSILFPDTFQSYTRAGDQFVFADCAGLTFASGEPGDVRRVELGNFCDSEIFGLADGRVVFARHTESGIEPWISDGAQSGTMLLADIEPGISSSFPRNFAAFGKKLVFAARQRNVGEELFQIEFPEVIENPSLEFPVLSERPPDLKDSGCGCSSAKTADPSALALLLLLWYTTRRRGAATDSNLVFRARRRAHGASFPSGEGASPR